MENVSVTLINPELINPPAFNSRTSYDEDETASLAESIKNEGQHQPVEVHKNGEGFVLHFGSRRVAACVAAGVPVKAIVVDAPMDEKEATFINAGENAQRADLTTFDLARTFAHLRELGAGVQEIADRLGFTKGYVSELTKQFVKLADPIKDAWERSSLIEKERNPGKLTERQAAEIKCVSGHFLRELVGESEAKQVEMFESAVIALMAQAEEEDEDGENGGKGKKGKKGKKAATAKETMYKVTATRYGDVLMAIKNQGEAVDAKMAKLLVQYLVGDIDKVKGVIGAPAEKDDKPAKAAKK